VSATLDSARASLKGRDFLRVNDWTSEELRHLLDVAIELKGRGPRGSMDLLPGRTLGMIFQKPSTRTRVSFEVAMYQLGGHALFLSAAELQLGRGETIRDTGMVLSRYLDAVMIRTFHQQDVDDLAEAATIPIVNGLTDSFHPCQAIADMQTVKERLGSTEGVTVAYFGDGNNVLHSLMVAATKLGANVVAATPEDYRPDPEVVKWAEAAGAETGATVRFTSDPREAARGADALYTDVWTSMGQEAENEKRLRDLAGYQLNAELVGLANDGAIVLHCLPAHYGEEITEDVLYGSQSAVWDQAENRLHAQKALLATVVS
jgi:ornithine carbamoyltransferase